MSNITNGEKVGRKQTSADGGMGPDVIGKGAVFDWKVLRMCVR